MVYNVIDDLGRVCAVFNTRLEAVKYAVQLEIKTGIDYDICEVYMVAGTGLV